VCQIQQSVLKNERSSQTPREVRQCRICHGHGLCGCLPSWNDPCASALPPCSEWGQCSQNAQAPAACLRCARQDGETQLCHLCLLCEEVLWCSSPAICLKLLQISLQVLQQHVPSLNVCTPQHVHIYAQSIYVHIRTM
jgi:hypothetical protein